MFGVVVGVVPALNASAELLGQLDDDALGAADVAQPVAVLVLHQLAHEFGIVGEQAGEDVLDVLDGERFETTLDPKRPNEFGDAKYMNQDGPVTTRRKIRFTDLLRCRSATRRVDATRSTFICRRTKNVTVPPSAVTRLYLGSTYVYPSSMKESVRGST